MVSRFWCRQVVAEVGAGVGLGARRCGLQWHDRHAKGPRAHLQPMALQRCAGRSLVSACFALRPQRCVLLQTRSRARTGRGSTSCSPWCRTAPSCEAVAARMDLLPNSGPATLPAVSICDFLRRDFVNFSPRQHAEGRRASRPRPPPLAAAPPWTPSARSAARS